MHEIEVRTLSIEELPEAAALLGRGMSDNPNSIAALGSDRAKRTRAFTGIFAAVLARSQRHGKILGAYEGARLVGVCVFLPPGTCKPAFGEQMTLLWAVIRNAGLTALPRALSWLGTWAKHDLPEPHWHLGPISVDAGMQGKGIGSALMREFCATVDASGRTAYLETDKQINVGFYERHGFSVTTELTVIGRPNWLMTRAAR